MAIEIAYTLIAVLSINLALVAIAGFKARKMSASGEKLALLADALEVERQAKALLSDSRKELALHEMELPYDLKEADYGKGLLAARVAASQARWTQGQLKYGDNIAGASARLGFAKEALALASKKAELGRIMLASQAENPEAVSDDAFEQSPQWPTSRTPESLLEASSYSPLKR